MASLIAAKPLSEEDGEALAPFDRAYAQRFGLEPILTRSSLKFYLRTGHAFAAYLGEEARGFVLAQAIWNGTRPTVYVNRLAVPDPEDTDSREALLEAVTKSAYDAAVYDLAAALPAADEVGCQTLEEARYKEEATRHYVRVLGSRGQRREGDG